VAVNALLKGDVSARHAPASVLAMGLSVACFYLVCRVWSGHVGGGLMDVPEFLPQPLAIPVLVSLLFIAIAGGMFVVPLYAFLTTKVDPGQAARTVAANNIINSGAMVIGALIAGGLSGAGVPLVEQVLLSAAMCLVSAWLGWMLHRAEREAAAAAAE
jgi:MFS family permease